MCQLNQLEKTGNVREKRKFLFQLLKSIRFCYFAKAWGVKVNKCLIQVNKKLAPVNAICLLDPTRIFVSHYYGKNFSSREPAHAQTKHQDNSTSGRGARASYRTMFPEISARGSLL